MKNVKIAMGGGRSLGVKTLRWLSSSQELFDVVAVCPMPYESDPQYYSEMMKVVQENNYRVCDIQELLDIEVDMGLSVNYHRIIGEDILCHCTKGFYNVHHSYNLRLRGRNITTHAILNTLDEKIFYHGTSLHEVAKKLDAGRIVASESVSINPDDTAYSLFKKVDQKALAMIEEWLPRLANEEVFPYDPPLSGVHQYRNADLPSRVIKEEMDAHEADTFIRAFDFPGKEPAYLMINGKKKHLVYNMRDQFSRKIKIKGRYYYTE